MKIDLFPSAPIEFVNQWGIVIQIRNEHMQTTWLTIPFHSSFLHSLTVDVNSNEVGW